MENISERKRQLTTCDHVFTKGKRKGQLCGRSTTRLTEKKCIQHNKKYLKYIESYRHKNLVKPFKKFYINPCSKITINNICEDENCKCDHNNLLEVKFTYDKGRNLKVEYIKEND